MQRCAAHADACVADNAIQLAVVRHRLIHQFFDGRSLAAIGLDKDGIAALGADAVCHSPPLLCTAGCTDHLHAVFAKALGNGPADATACAGDDGHFAFDTVKIHPTYSPFLDHIVLLQPFHFIVDGLPMIYRIYESDLQPSVAYPSLWCYNNTVAQELQSAVSGVSGV